MALSGCGCCCRKVLREASTEPRAVPVPNTAARGHSPSPPSHRRAPWGWLGGNQGDAGWSRRTQPPSPALPDLRGQSYLRKRRRCRCCRVFSSRVKAARGPPAAPPCFGFPHSKAVPSGCPKTPRGDAPTNRFCWFKKKKHQRPNRCCSWCEFLDFWSVSSPFRALGTVPAATSAACGTGPRRRGTGLRRIPVSKWHLTQS